MQKLAWAITGAVFVGAVSFVVAAAGSSGSATRTLTLSLVQDSSAAHTNDAPPKGPSAGDVFVYSATVRKAGRVVGRLEGSTTAMDPKYQGDVSTQYLVLNDGTIAIVGGGQSGAPGVGRPDTKIYDSVVGGTGAYVGAGSWVSARNVSGTVEIMTIHLTR